MTEDELLSIIGRSTSDPIAVAIKADTVSAWSHNETSGNYIDLVGSNDLVPSGLISSASGKIGNCSASLTGIASVTAAALSPADSSFTWAGWFKCDTDGFQGVVGSGDAGDGWGIRIGFSSNLNFLLLKGGVDGQTNTGSIITTGVWMFIVFGYNHAGAVRFYSIDGAAKTEVAHATGVGASGQAFNIHRGYNQLAIDNSLDESLFVSRVLTDSEIAWLYNAGSGRAVSTIANA